MGLHPLTALSLAHFLEGKRYSRVILQCSPGMSASTWAQGGSSKSQMIFIRGQGKKFHLTRLYTMVPASDKLSKKVVKETGCLHEMQINLSGVFKPLLFCICHVQLNWYPRYICPFVLYALVVMATSGSLNILLQCFSKEAPWSFPKMQILIHWV